MTDYVIEKRALKVLNDLSVHYFICRVILLQTS